MIVIGKGHGASTTKPTSIAERSATKRKITSQGAQTSPPPTRTELAVPGPVPGPGDRGPHLLSSGSGHSPTGVGNARRRSIHKSTLESGAPQDSGLQLEDGGGEREPHQSASQVWTEAGYGRKRHDASGLMQEMDAVTSFFRGQHACGSRIFSNPGRVLDLYKKSFNKSQFFPGHQAPEQPRSSSSSQPKPPEFRQSRARTPNNAANRSRRSYVNFLQRHKKSSVGVPYQSTAPRDSEQAFAVGSKFPQRSMPPQRQSLLLSKQSSVSGPQASQHYIQKCLSPNMKNSGGFKFDANLTQDQRGSPLQVHKKNIEHTSIKSGKYDTLKAMNASETSKKVEEPQFPKVITQPQVKMQPAGRASRAADGFKSTLSNTSFINKLSSRRDVMEAMDAMGDAVGDVSKSPDAGPENASASSSDGQLNKWATNPFSSTDAPKDPPGSARNQKALEIKGADGDKVMILQFDPNQLDAFNDLLEQQIVTAKNEAKSSRESKTGSQKILPTDRSQGHSSNRVFASPAEKPGTTPSPTRKQAREKAAGRAGAKRSGLFSQANDLQYILETPASGFNAEPGLQTPKGSNQGSPWGSSYSPQQPPSRLEGSQKSRQGRKQPVDLSKFMSNGREDSHLSSPGHESPNSLLAGLCYRHLHAAKYQHQHRRDVDATSRMLFSRGSDTDTTLHAPGALSEVERARAFSHHDTRGIPMKEFKVDIRKPVSPPAVLSPPQPSRVASADTFRRPSPVAQKPRSFLQHLQLLTKKFGRRLVGEYLMTKNLSSMRRLIQLERSQHCNCPFRQQLSSAIRQHLEEARSAGSQDGQQQAQQTKNQTSGMQTQTSARGAGQEGGEVGEPSPQRQTSPVSVITARPCKNCLSQSNVADLLDSVYQRQVQQKLQPVQGDPAVAAAPSRTVTTSTRPKRRQLHHARYFKKPVEEKHVRDLKRQALLNKARNSKVLNVVSMNDVKGFDRHIERCLTVKNDSVFHKAEIEKSGAEAGLVFQSVVLDTEPTKSILTNLEDHSSKAPSMAPQARAACDVSALRVNRNETSSTPSLSPPPMMVLNPRQEDQQPTDEEEEETKLGSTRQRAKKAEKSQKFFFFKGRNYSTLSRHPEQHQSSTNVRDQLQKVLGSTKGSDQPDMVIGSGDAQDRAPFNRAEKVATEQNAKRNVRTSVIMNSSSTNRFSEGEPRTEQTGGTEVKVNQLKAVAMLNRGRGLAQRNQDQNLSSHEVSTHMLPSAQKENTMTPASKQSQFKPRYRENSSYKANSMQKVSPVREGGVVQPHYSVSKVQSNHNEVLRASPLNMSKTSDLMQLSSYQQRVSPNNMGRSSGMQDDYQDYSQVNFKSSKHAPRELAKFFKQARENALRQSLDLNSTKREESQYASQSELDSTRLVQNWQQHNHSNDRRGLKTSENQVRSHEQKKGVPALSRKPSNTRYCKTRLRSKQEAASLTQLVQEANNETAVTSDTGKRRRLKLGSQKPQPLTSPLLSSHLSQIAAPTGSKSTKANGERQKEPVVFEALRPTILTPTSALSRPDQDTRIKLIVSRDLNSGHRKSTDMERCVKVNPRHIVVKGQPRQMRQLLYSSFLSSEKQQKFHISDRNVASFN